MKKQKFGIVILVALFLAGCAGCTVPEGEEAVPGSITIMTWNVHNLFDGEDNGYEYEEFLQSSGWSEEKFLGRINTISDAINRIDPLPDIIILQEIESLAVIEALINSLRALSTHAVYSWSHFAGNPGAAVGLGILSRYPLLDVKAHSITINNDSTPRPVMEARIQTQEEFIIFACHWKSKIGGEDATEKTRKASARVILRRTRELWQDEPDLGIIVAGDLNLNHNEFYRRNASIICALLPDDPYCAQTTNGIQKDFLVISRNTPPIPVHFPQETIIFYSPWMKELENGSYYYRNNWETIDHFLVSKQFFNTPGWEYEKTEIINFPPFANANGIPVPYNVRSGLGLSDHLPLVLTLNMRE
jgi:endonuclease/exonuclease/phosphatase family metal-dependent hydrolase